MPKPVFGNRPGGMGFRPEASGGRPGLIRQQGLQDAMKAARANPMDPGTPAAPVMSAYELEVNQAMQTLRNVQEARGRQLATQATNRRRGSSAMRHVVDVDLPPPPPTTLVAIQSRLGAALQNLGHSGAGVEVRQKAGAIVLEGVIDSEDKRAVIELLVRMEPGVYEVENHLRVARE